LTRETAAATQEAICATLGLSRQTFRASAFLAQGDGAAFTDAQPRDRKRILCEVLGLDIWDRLLERARADRRTVEDETQQLAGALAVAERDLELKSVAERDRVTAQSELGTAKEKLAAADVELLARDRAAEQGARDRRRTVVVQSVRWRRRGSSTAKRSAAKPSSSTSSA
jgi:exonuclease SbcC